MGRALVLHVGHVPGYGEAHITVAFFPEKMPTWLRHKLPEIVCYSSAFVANKEPKAIDPILAQTPEAREQRARRLKELREHEQRERDRELREQELRELEKRERASKDLLDKMIYTFMREWARQDPHQDPRSAGEPTIEKEWEML
jgi:hypothetical protein